MSDKPLSALLQLHQDRVALGPPVRLGPEDRIGRSARAELPVGDPAVSELHAWLSLRGSALFLMAARGRLHVQGGEAEEVRLEPGLVVSLSGRSSIEVLDLDLPERLWRAVGIGPVPMLLDQPCYSLLPGEGRRLVEGRRPGSLGWLQWEEGAWWWQGAALSARRLLPGEAVDLSAGLFFAVEELNLLSASPEATWTRSRLPGGGSPAQGGLSIVLDRSRAILRDDAGAELVLVGKAGALVRELHLWEQAAWEDLYPLLWEGEAVPTEPEPRRQARARFDRVVAHLRQRLAEKGLRPDLIRANAAGAGRYALWLNPADSVDDRAVFARSP